MNLVLDLDGTLGSEERNFEIPKPRPFLEQFLDYCFEAFESVSIWTAAPLEWAQVYLSKVIPLKFSQRFLYVLVDDHCSRKHMKPLKKLWKKPGFTKHNTLIVENSWKTCRLNYGNAIYIQTFRDNSLNDMELLKLVNYLKKMHIIFNHLGTVRLIDKRSWSTEVAEVAEEEEEEDH